MCYSPTLWAKAGWTKNLKNKMELKEDFKKRADFRNHLRTNLSKLLQGHHYLLTYDNQPTKENEKSWTFKLVYTGDKTVEISNKDWRDYTEYFHVYVNGQEIFLIDIDKYNDLKKAFKEIESKLTPLL